MNSFSSMVLPAIAIATASLLGPGCSAKDDGASESMTEYGGGPAVIHEGMGGSGTQEEYDGPTRENEIVGPTGQAFSPESIKVAFTGEGKNSLELVAFTLRSQDDVYDPTRFLFALKNIGTEVICYPDARMQFYSKGGSIIVSGGNLVFVEAQPWLTYGSPSPCVGPGDTAMGELKNLPVMDVDTVGKITYQSGGLITPSADEISGIEYSGVEVYERFTGSWAVKGQLVNGTGLTMKNPSVEVFVVDPVGRPIDVVTDIELTTIPAKGIWSFETLGADTEFEKFVFFPDFSVP